MPNKITTLEEVKLLVITKNKMIMKHIVIVFDLLNNKKLSITQISGKHNKSRQQIYNIMKKYGINPFSREKT